MSGLKQYFNLGDVRRSWDNGAIDHYLFRADVANNASGPNSKLVDLRVGSVSKISVGPDGKMALRSAGNSELSLSADTGDTSGARTIDLLFKNGSAETVVGRIRWDETTTTLNFGYGANNHLSIGSSGNVGVGNAAPGALLTVGPGSGSGQVNNAPGGASDFYTLVQSVTALETASSNLSISDGLRNSRVKFFLTDHATIGSGAWGHWMTWSSGGAQPYVIGSASVEQFRISTSGSVGIANTAPAHTLHIGNGTTATRDLKIDALTTAAFYLRSAGADKIVLNSNAISYINTGSGLAIGATTGNANAILTLTSTTKAFMPPRMTTTQKNAIASPTAGMVVYDSTLGKLALYNGSAWRTVTDS